ncbi:branched-chain amino acid ABC transporter permease [Pinisolibacter aquiterrae]|jgi:branched-chain amino acid transport system permease protein|uniref:branched-chain amino acid ABC transporter permease n=1 Tax=Pinisolibacter aquiterrae TaxID=2815579 RepID=UPI001C3CF851|nr:branched-chain amino acid ABC transporter permease [Pinisolibacter aquiterrae]MBV5265879.1 branched-chain amino acid ABC transporter permease [Pinisolibacter aquiterrae]MCC8236557.1 branched-chain amino acid ABC transporter permease [Pinisolibacter aquiterrae]
MDFLLLLVSTGLVTGAAYGLIAMGFALVYKATGVVNFAQGELMMLTAYVSFSVADRTGLSFLMLMALTIPISMAIGLLLERIFIRPMLGEPVFSIVMVTIGLAVILRGLVILVWGPDPAVFDVGLPDTVIRLGPVPFYPAQLVLVAAMAGVTTIAWIFLRFSRIGIAMRAVAANETAARLSGISVSRIHAFAWMFSSAIASIAGVLFAANFKLAPDMWFQGMKSFPAVILGGLDSVIGASVAGLVIGVVENLFQGYVGQGMREISGFIVIVVVLMVRPYGLFGSREIERV